MKIVIKEDPDSFLLSEEALALLGITSEEVFDLFNSGHTPEEQIARRSDPRLVECLIALGDRASHRDGSRLRLLEIPDGIKCYICEDHPYHSGETIHEAHRTWC